MLNNGLILDYLAFKLKLTKKLQTLGHQQKWGQMAISFFTFEAGLLVFFVTPNYNLCSACTYTNPIKNN